MRLYPALVRDMAAFDALLAAWHAMLHRPGRFALLSFGDHPADEPKAVSGARGKFFKANREVFRARCAVIVGIEPDPALRAERDAEAEGARRGLGFTIRLAATEAEALAIAHTLLAHGEG